MLYLTSGFFSEIIVEESILPACSSISNYAIISIIRTFHMQHQVPSKSNNLVVFFKNIGTAFDRFAKPYDWFYSLQNTQHVTVSVKIDSNNTIEEYYTTVFLEENKDYLTNKTLLIQPTAFKLANHSFSTTVKFDKKNYTAFKKSLKNIKSKSYDCLILPQVLNNCLEYAEVIGECKRILKPNGTLLCTALSISTPTINNLWGFTSSALKYMFAAHFDVKQLHQRSYGNALVGRLFLEKKKASNLATEELNYSDLYFPVVVGIRATK